MQLWQNFFYQNSIFYITQRGITPKTQVYQSHCDRDLYLFKHVLFIVKLVASMATDLALFYANFAPVNVLNFQIAPLHVCTMLR